MKSTKNMSALVISSTSWSESSWQILYRIFFLQKKHPYDVRAKCWYAMYWRRKTYELMDVDDGEYWKSRRMHAKNLVYVKVKYVFPNWRNQKPVDMQSSETCFISTPLIYTHTHKYIYFIVSKIIYYTFFHFMVAHFSSHCNSSSSFPLCTRFFFNKYSSVTYIVLHTLAHRTTAHTKMRKFSVTKSIFPPFIWLELKEPKWY